MTEPFLMVTDNSEKKHCKLRYLKSKTIVYSRPSTQLMPCTNNNISGCHATNHLIQSSS